MHQGGCIAKAAMRTTDRSKTEHETSPSTIFLRLMQRLEIFVRSFLDTLKVNG